MVLDLRRNIQQRRGFTLVEILVVVVILGILAAVVIPRFGSATTEASTNATYYELQKVRRAIDVYMARNENQVPEVTTGFATWGALVGNGEYLKSNPYNRYITTTNEGRVYAAADAAPDTVYQNNYGWIFNTATGELWAGSFDDEDNPLPKP
ncbi:MAG: hypothetical protein DHS20C14_10580 [Phycisphaeraceae bacterium]|nr:MAG: hypothetical protein DHS20C14_10580 [Phycisphaeraceae bacterium]